MVPEGWKDLRLDQICSKKIVYGIVQAGEHVETGVPYIKSSDVGREIEVAGLSKTAPEIHKKFGRSSVRPGDIVFSLRGNTGATSIVPNNLPEANLTQGTARLAVSTEYDTRFVRFMLGSNSIMRQVLAVAKGSTFTEVSLDALRKITLAAPPLPEQQKIAEILSTWDKAIETTEALLANARTQKRALMQSLLTGTRRFPGFEDHPWREVRLGDVCNIRKGEQKSKNTLDTEGPFPVINGGISPSGYTDEWNAKAGTITISEGGNSCGFANLMDVPFWSGGHCYTLEDLRIERDYLFFWLKFREAEIMRLRVGSGLPNIQKKAITNFPVIMPSSQEQARIVDVISFAFQEEKAIESNLDHLRTEKKSLMQQLLTGKRRVIA